MDTKTIIDCFLHSVKEEKSKNTYRVYKVDCMHLLDYLTSFEMSIYFLMEQNEVDKYVEYLRESGYSDTTIKHNICMVRSLIKFCIEKKLLPDKDFKIRSNTENPKVFYASKEDVSKIYRYCTDLDNAEYFSIRAKIITLFVLLFGFKVSELSDLRISDISIKNGLITTLNTFKYIYNESFIPQLNTLLKCREEALSSMNIEYNDYLFISRFGDKCSTNALNNDFKKICNELSLENVTLSSLRNTCIIYYYDNLPDKTIISKVFGITERRIIELLEKR